MLLLIGAVAAGAVGGWFASRFHITRKYGLIPKKPKASDDRPWGPDEP